MADNSRLATANVTDTLALSGYVSWCVGPVAGLVVFARSG